MKKTEISGQLYVVVGVAMLLMSVFIDYEKLMLFILAGAVFIVVGFLKLVIKSGDAKNKIKKTHNAYHEKAYYENHQKNHQSTHEQIIRCRNCHVKVHPLFKFFPNCGHELFMEEHYKETQSHKNKH